MNCENEQKTAFNTPLIIQVMAFRTDKIFKHLCLGALDYEN
jgi:hypothetical protein